MHSNWRPYDPLWMYPLFSTLTFSKHFMNYIIYPFTSIIFLQTIPKTHRSKRYFRTNIQDMMRHSFSDTLFLKVILVARPFFHSIIHLAWGGFIHTSSRIIEVLNYTKTLLYKGNFSSLSYCFN